MARLLAKGLTYQAVADQLVVSYHTVKKHVQNIYQKCGVNSPVSAVPLDGAERPPKMTLHAKTDPLQKNAGQYAGNGDSAQHFLCLSWV